jgi:hypothetical protein
MLHVCAGAPSLPRLDSTRRLPRSLSLPYTRTATRAAPKPHDGAFVVNALAMHRHWSDAPAGGRFAIARWTHTGRHTPLHACLCRRSWCPLHLLRPPQLAASASPASSHRAGVTLFVLTTGQLPVGRADTAYPDRFFARPAATTDHAWDGYKARCSVLLAGGHGEHLRQIVRWFTQADPAARPTAMEAWSSTVSEYLQLREPTTDLAVLAAGRPLFYVQPPRTRVTGHVDPVLVAEAGGSVSGGSAAGDSLLRGSVAAGAGVAGAGAGSAGLTWEALPSAGTPGVSAGVTLSGALRLPSRPPPPGPDEDDDAMGR